MKAVIGALDGLFPFRKARPGDQLRLERARGRRAAPLLATARAPRTSGSSSGSRTERSRARSARSSSRPRSAASRSRSTRPSTSRSRAPARIRTSRCSPPTCSPGTSTSTRTSAPATGCGSSSRRSLADGKLLRYGEVLAAEYDGSATGRKRLFRYTDPTGADELLRRRGPERAARVPQVAAQVREHHLQVRRTGATRCSATTARTRASTTARPPARRSGRSATARCSWRAGTAAAARP